MFLSLQIFLSSFPKYTRHIYHYKNKLQKISPLPSKHWTLLQSHMASDFALFIPSPDIPENPSMMNSASDISFPFCKNNITAISFACKAILTTTSTFTSFTTLQFFTPLISLQSLILLANSSTARTKARGKIRQPCQIPDSTAKKV